MSSSDFNTLPPVFSHFEDPISHKTPLAPVTAGFFVPKLENKPQNPIIESLDLPFRHELRISRFDEATGGLSDDFHRGTLAAVTNGIPVPKKSSMKPYERQVENIWMIAAAGSHAHSSKLKTWDCLRSTYAHDATDGDLLSEQHPDIVSAAEHFVVPHAWEASQTALYMLPAELLDILVTNLTGHSSRLFEWDSSSETFVQSTAYSSRIILVHGYTEGLGKEIIQRYLRIGTSLRRLDEFIVKQRMRKLHSTMYAFLHAVETVVATLRKQIVRSRPSVDSVFSKLWLQYSDIEQLLDSLTSLCLVGAESTPPYPHLPSDAADLLSHIYSFVDLHSQSGSPRALRSALAYLLTTSSRPFFRDVEHSIGIGKSNISSASTALDVREGDFETATGGALNFESDSMSYPSFFSTELQRQTNVATRSLKVLSAAKPDHPLLAEYVDRKCEWVWHEDQIDAIYAGHRMRSFDGLTPSGSGHPLATTQIQVTNPDEGVKYEPDLVNFKIFDMEPGAQWSSSDMRTTSLPIDTRPYENFLATFPEDLPSSTPTLAHLSEAIMHPLQLQSNRLTNTLLTLFLQPPLSLPDHLSLLRTFALLSSQGFTYRLRGALFSDSDAYQPVGRGTRARTRARLGIKEPRDVVAETEDLQGPEGGQAKWGIGLGLGLSERGTWPPGGAELGFALRRVIVDSLEEMKAVPDGESSDDEIEVETTRYTSDVVKEAEWRLGFAIRDLPASEGREEWLNPSSLAALDFLYLDYKPPLPVGALVTPDILSKYQRIFNFLLRLLRVDTVSRGIFKTTHKGEALFSQDPGAQHLLHRFRFHTHSFVSTLVSYIFDTAIGLPLDAFTSKLHEVSTAHTKKMSTSATEGDTRLQRQIGQEDESEEPIADVFEIMEEHSRVLDKILGGCILRTPQRALCDVLEDILAIVLRLGTLVRDVKLGFLVEESASAELEKLHNNFERKMITFTKVLRAMDDKSELRSLLSALATNDRDYEILSRNAGGPKREIGLSDLLVRLDPGEWWKSEMERRAKAKRERTQSQG